MEKFDIDISLGSFISFFTKNFDIYLKIQSSKSYQKEKYCLQKLESNYKCICKKKCNHFPKIVSYNDKLNIIVMTHHGYDCKYLNRLIKVPDHKKQVECIVSNLKNSNLSQNDMLPKNICINSKGVITLIDYDLAKIDNITDDEYQKIKFKLTKILKDNNYLLLK